MASAIPSQYQISAPPEQSSNLSSLQLAVKYYMEEGGQTPFFINQEFLRQFTTFASSGVVTPAQVNQPTALSVILVGDEDVYIIRPAEDCGPDQDRYEQVYIGKRSNIIPNAWTFGGVVVRGGSAATGAGGPWGTGGLTGPDPSPNNSVDRRPDIVSNLSAAYGATAQTTTNGIA